MKGHHGYRACRNIDPSGLDMRRRIIRYEPNTTELNPARSSPYPPEKVAIASCMRRPGVIDIANQAVAALLGESHREKP
jgi:hypothetical protein